MGSENREIDRRTFLALAGASAVGLAGCSGDSASGATSTPGGTATPTTTPPPDTSTPVPDDTTSAPTTQPADESDPSEAVTRMETELEDATFEGEYVDTHAHWQEGQSGVVPAYAKRMKEYDIGAAVLFCPSRAAATDYERFLRTLTGPDVDYLPFMSAPPPGPNLPSELRSLYEDAGAAFWGIGEWKPQSKPARAFDGDQLSRLWQLAADLDVPVMYHPFPGQEGEVESALAAHPETTFLLHGHQMINYGQERRGLGPTLPRLLSEYDNIYWTLDVASMTAGSLVRFRSAGEFLDWWDANAENYVDSNQNVLSTLLDAGPNQVMWGTDVAWEYNLEDEIFSRVMDFTEQVLAGVPDKHHAAYKRENAIQLFGL